ncbi:MAG: response regulator [Methylococcaceae bacterium]
MNYKTKKTYESLQQRLAEQLSISQAAQDANTTGRSDLSPAANEILQELYVYQIELEIQNEDLRQAQLALIESRNHYSDMYEFTPVGYLALNLSGVVVEVNFTGAKLLGLNKNKMINYSFARFVANSDKYRWYQSFLKANKKDGKQQCQLALFHADGTIVYAHIDCTFVERKNKRPPVVLVTVTDMTQLKKIEQLLIDTNNKAMAANVSKSKFLTKISHEIRTSLNSVMGIHYLLAQTKLDLKQHAYLKNIDTAAQSLLEIIDPISDFLKMEEGDLIIEKEPFSLDGVLANISGFLDLKAAEKGIKIILDVSADTPKNLCGDALRLTQVLTNLVGNAVKFTEQGEVVVTVRPEWQTINNTRLIFSIQDTGIGMTAKQVANLFQSVMQFDHSIVQQYGDTGLGLVISKRLMELMNGTISAESTIGKGSQFTMSVELGVSTESCVEARQRLMVMNKNVAANLLNEFSSTFDPSNDVQPLIEQMEVLPHQPASLKGRQVLLVDDNEINQELMSELLTNLGIVVKIASNGQEAVDWVKAESFDLVLMDIQMPIMDGLTATTLIRADSQFADLPIIALTAHALESDKEKSLAAGLNDHINKPLDSQKLIETLHFWLR